MAREPYEDMQKFLKYTFQEIRKGNKLDEKIFIPKMEEELQKAHFREKFPCGVENILILRVADAAGDFILTSGFIREVRNNFPKARITLLVHPHVYSIAELCPYVNEVLAFDGLTDGKKFLDVLKSISKFCRDNLWSRNFSTAFCSQWGSDSMGGLFVAFMSGARERLGYGCDPYDSWIDNFQNEYAYVNDNLLTRNIISPKTVIHEAEKHFYLLEATGFKVSNTRMELWYDEKDFLNARELLKKLPVKRGKRAVVGIGAGGGSRKYPVKKLLEALKKIQDRGINFVIIGGATEKKDADFLEKNLPSGSVLNLVAQTTFRETEAIISQMDFYIGNDSGVMHMAAAADVPVLAIYREAKNKENEMQGILSEYRRFSPWQTIAVIIRPKYALDDCAHKKFYGGCCHAEAHCITQITPEEIVAGFEELEEKIKIGKEFKNGKY